MNTQAARTAPLETRQAAQQQALATEDAHLQAAIADGVYQSPLNRALTAEERALMQEIASQQKCPNNPDDPYVMATTAAQGHTALWRETLQEQGTHTPALRALLVKMQSEFILIYEGIIETDTEKRKRLAPAAATEDGDTYVPDTLANRVFYTNLFVNAATTADVDLGPALSVLIDTLQQGITQAFYTQHQLQDALDAQEREDRPA